ncbi:SHOCT domain-containing protein [Haloplasma contractile]|uniref:Membrane protein n=1 Tax=Haloplasma contractile SSD-17B TaxID=1033810 RepID=U2DUK3_9MOLU|nr:hypothetical protein [Haloplasma contractile]ERJ12082.1 Putative membrane protein [Haloplasma contractile SSD-17B]
MLFNCFDGYHLGRGAWLGNGLMGLFIIALVAVIIILLFKKDSTPTKRKTNNDAMKLLDKKFVTGELTEEEYIHRKNLLKK